MPEKYFQPTPNHRFWWDGLNFVLEMPNSKGNWDLVGYYPSFGWFTDTALMYAKFVPKMVRQAKLRDASNGLIRNAEFSKERLEKVYNPVLEAIKGSDISAELKACKDAFVPKELSEEHLNKLKQKRSKGKRKKS